MCWHRWSKWTAHSHYTDTSYGHEIPSTELIRRCSRCGLPQSRVMHGLLPLEAEA